MSEITDLTEAVEKLGGRMDTMIQELQELNTKTDAANQDRAIMPELLAVELVRATTA